MKLRSKIMIVTFFTILFVQGINCFLGIGFLLNNLEENSIKKYQIIGNEIQRKLNKSLIFGKPLTHINYERLLSYIIPENIENLHIIDTQGKPIYSLKENINEGSFLFQETPAQIKTSEHYNIYIPLEVKSEIKGNILIIVSLKENKVKFLYLVKKSLINFLLVVVFTLPILYFLLTMIINKPFMRYVNNLERLIENENFDELKDKGIDLTPVINIRNQIEKIKKGEWLFQKNRNIHENFDFIVHDSENISHNQSLYKKFIKLLNSN
ncbi:MAG: hypothetical protein H8D87_12980 [Deltaproteobacteria bacterium]|uniref:hypothetical protein n=1 Tax=Desulfobacula sp. TaxID=2593537 RepID=UPI0019B45C5D|nr:hypothetical protein [Candidatus Desulfobacula maris]MBL6993064.1 hypothetical protein [Desulfobacula sp.]